MKTVPVLDAQITQAQFALLVGLSEARVSQLAGDGVLVRGGSAREWVSAYCDRLREMAAGRGGDDGPALVAERARLAREQADKIAMQNAVTRGELAPVHLLEQVIVRAGARMARLLDTIPGTVRRRYPQLGADDIAEITRIVTKARNVAASMRLADLDRDDYETAGLDGFNDLPSQEERNDEGSTRTCS